MSKNLLKISITYIDDKDPTIYENVTGISPFGNSMARLDIMTDPNIDNKGQIILIEDKIEHIFIPIDNIKYIHGEAQSILPKSNIVVPSPSSIITQ